MDPFKLTLEPYFSAAASNYGVPQNLLQNLVARDGFNPQQLKLPAADRLAQINNRLDTGTIIQQSAKSLAATLNRTGGDYAATVADYLGIADIASPEVSDILQKSGIEVAPKTERYTPVFGTHTSNPSSRAVTGAVDQSLDDFWTWLTGNFWAAIIFGIGMLLIIFGLYGMVMKGKNRAETIVQQVKAGS